jgi:rod shape-determining protein MreC
MLLTETRSRLAVALLDEPGSLGVIEGDRGSSMTINLIPAGATVSPGDLIVTSGLEPGIRRGLLVGTVEKISREPQDPFQKALVVPADAARHPLFVEILLTPDEE